MTDLILKSWTGADEDPYVDSDFVDVTDWGSMKIDGAELKPNTQSNVYRMMYLNREFDDNDAEWIVTVVLGSGPAAWSDRGGPAMIVPNGDADEKNAYHVDVHGNTIKLRKTTPTGSTSTLIDYGTFGSLASTDQISLVIDDPLGTPTWVMRYNGSPISGSGSTAVGDYLAKLQPGVAARYATDGTNARGYTGFGTVVAEEGTPWSYTSVNGGADITLTDTTVLLVGTGFQAVTITDIVMTQDGIPAPISVTNNVDSDTQITVTLPDFWASTLLEGETTFEVQTSDGGNKSQAVDYDVLPYYQDNATSVIADPPGMFKDVTTPGGTDYLWYLQTVATSPVNLDADGPYLDFIPKVPNGTETDWYHADATTRAKTIVEATINDGTTDATPTLTAPVVQNETTNTAEIGCTTDVSGGNIYWCVRESDVQPTFEEIVAGTGATDYGTVNPVTAGVIAPWEADVLQPSKTYYGWMVHAVTDPSLQSNILPTGSFNTEAVPVLSNLTADTITLVGANISVDTDTGAGTLYWVVTSDTNTPASADIIADTVPGTVDSDSQSVSATGTQGPITTTGGTEGQELYYWFTQQEAGEIAALVAGDTFTVGVTPAEEVGLENPESQLVSATTAQIRVDTNRDTGRMYWSVWDTSAVPSKADIIAGTGADSYGSYLVTASGTQPWAAVGGLTPETGYWYWFHHDPEAS